jgi:quercetin dioxygenase-like cupin family protein
MKLLDPQPSTKAPAERFTGDAWWNVIYAGQEPSRARLNLVRFAPSARTNWHSHLVGQTLHVVAGVALIGTRDGAIIETHAGETVTCPPGEQHWHGATGEQFMEHLALWEGDGTDTAETTWLEPVTDQQYAGPRSNVR